MISHLFHRVHAGIARFVRFAYGVLSWLMQPLARTVALIKNTVCTVFLISLLSACHTSRHVVTHVDSTCVSQTGHREHFSSNQFDSLFSQLSASADSITIVLYGNAFHAASPDDYISVASCGETASSTPGAISASYVTSPVTLQDSIASSSSPSSAAGTFAGVMGNHPPAKARITIHAPRVNKEERRGSNSCVETNVADSTRSNSEAHTSTDVSKESIGGAEPPNLTWVFIVLGLGITLLLIGAIFGYCWLHKKGLF